MTTTLPSDPRCTPGWCKIDSRLGSAATRVPAASREDSYPQAIFKIQLGNSFDYRFLYKPQLNNDLGLWKRIFLVLEWFLGCRNIFFVKIENTFKNELSLKFVSMNSNLLKAITKRLQMRVAISQGITKYIFGSPCPPWVSRLDT